MSKRLFLALPAGVFLAIFLGGPLLLLVRLSLCVEPEGRGFYQPGTWTLAGYTSTLIDGDFQGRVGFTFLQAVAVTALTLSLAYPLALFLAGLAPRWRTLALGLVLLPKFASVLVVLYGLQAILSGSGPINALLLAMGLTREPLLLNRGLVGMILAEVYLILPFPLLLLDVGLRRVPGDLIAAARGLGSTRWQAFWRITWPLTARSRRAAVALTLLWALSAFLGPLHLGTPEQTTLAVDLFTQAIEYNNWPRAAVRAVLLLTLAGLVAGALALLTPSSPAIPAARPVTSCQCGGPLGWAVLLLFQAPLGYAVWFSFSPTEIATAPGADLSLRWYGELVREPRWLAALGNSLLTGLATAVLALLLALPAALVGSPRLGLAFRVTLALPPLVLGIGLLPTMHLLHLHGTRLALILAHTLAAAPVVYLVLAAAVRDLPADLLPAARGLGAGPLTVFRRITLPLLTPALLAAGLLAFLLSLNELLLTIFLATPTTATLPRVLWPELRYALSPLVAAAATAGLVTTAIGLLVIHGLLRFAKFR